MHFHLDLVRLHQDVAADHGHDFLAQQAQEIGFCTTCPLIREQNLETIPRERCRTTPILELNQSNMLMRLSVRTALPNKLFASLGIVIGTSSPLRRRTASL